MEFQPIILAGGRGSRMYPLTEECPKALLSVGNMPLIWYPIQLLQKNGFKEALVVVRDSQRHVISEALEGLQERHGVHLNFILCDIPDHEDWGTADSLRHIRSKIKLFKKHFFDVSVSYTGLQTDEVIHKFKEIIINEGDILLISCDLVTSFSLHALTLFHHAHHSTVTALFYRPPKVDEELVKKKTAGMTVERDLLGLTEQSRIVLFSSQADLEESLELQRSMLQEYPHVKVSSQLIDAHLYLVKRWVIDYLGDKKHLSSVKGEVIPHLVRHQYQSSSQQTMRSAANSYLDEVQEKAYKMSCASSKPWGQIMRCHACVIENELCTRVNTIQSFLEINRLLPHRLPEFGLQSTSVSRNKGVGGDCMVSSEGVSLGEKVSVKHSCVGKYCLIGDKTKILNCIIMDHVQIGEGCSLLGCILSSHARIEDHVTLRDCQVGTNFTVTKEADLKGEALVVGGGIDF